MLEIQQLRGWRCQIIHFLGAAQGSSGSPAARRTQEAALQREFYLYIYFILFFFHAKNAAIYSHNLNQCPSIRLGGRGPVAAKSVPADESPLRPSERKKKIKIQTKAYAVYFYSHEIKHICHVR